MQFQLTVAIALATLGQGAFAAGNTLFDDVGPNAAANVPIMVGSPLEATNPLVLPSPLWTQTSIASRDAQLVLGEANTGVWDMIDSNRTGPDANRYLFVPFEAGNSGAQRIDTWTGETKTIVTPGTNSWTRGDASRWAPWGGWLTGEESCCASGRLFEVTNPVTTTGPNDVNFVQRNDILPHVAHEGLAFDSLNSLYFVDENSSGSIYKFVSDTPNAMNGDDFFGAGTTYALTVGAGQNASTAGSFTWEALDLSATTDGRAAADAAGATAFNRPEDLEIRDLGAEQLFFAATGTDEVWTVDLDAGEIFRFATQSTIDIATGVAVGSAFNNPDNLAIDADLNIYIVEDQTTPNADIWRVVDVDHDGVAEGLSRWAALQVTGAEPSGLFFSLADPNIAYVNVQHPSSGNDQTIRINAVSAVPLPPALYLFAPLLAGLAARRRKP